MLELSLVVKCYSSKSRADYWRMSEMKLVRDERDGLMYRLNCGCTGRSSRDRHGFSQHHKRWQVTVHLQLDHSCPQTRSTVSWSSFGVVSGFLTSFRPIHTHNSNLCQTSAYKITRVRPYAPWIPPARAHRQPKMKCIIWLRSIHCSSHDSTPTKHSNHAIPDITLILLMPLPFSILECTKAVPFKVLTSTYLPLLPPNLSATKTWFNQSHLHRFGMLNYSARSKFTNTLIFS